MRGIVDHWGAEVSADVEEVVLDPQQKFANVVVKIRRGKRHANRAVGLVDIGVGLQPRIILARATHVAQGGGAVVAGTGVDTRQIDHGHSVWDTRVPRLQPARGEGHVRRMLMWRP